MHLIVFANPLENDFATSVNSLVMSRQIKGWHQSGYFADRHATIGWDF
jgi:hypothetical protein